MRDSIVRSNAFCPPGSQSAQDAAASSPEGEDATAAVRCVRLLENKRGGRKFQLTLGRKPQFQSFLSRGFGMHVFHYPHLLRSVIGNPKRDPLAVRMNTNLSC